MKNLKYLRFFENFQLNEAYVKGIGMDMRAFSDKPDENGTCYRFANVGQTTATTTGDVGSIHTAKQMGFADLPLISNFLDKLKSSDEQKLLVLNILYPDGTNVPTNQPPKDDEKNNYCVFFTQFDGPYHKVLDKLVDPFGLSNIGQSRDGFSKDKFWFSSSLKGREDAIIKSIGDWEDIWYYQRYGREKE